MRLQDLPRHSQLIDALCTHVETHDQWRWLELGCSLATNRGDELSDIDAAVGHQLDPDEVASSGRVLVRALGAVNDLLVHAEDSWPPGVVRFAAEYQIGVQLDLVAMPAKHRAGLPENSVALVDKDETLAEPWVPPVAKASGQQAREWTMLGWWALSNVAKYVERHSLFEAVDAVTEARNHALRLFAVGRNVPYPAFGLTSLLDFEPFELPDQLDASYAAPLDPANVISAGYAVAELLESAAEEAGRVLNTNLTTPWSAIARTRLHTAHKT